MGLIQCHADIVWVVITGDIIYLLRRTMSQRIEQEKDGSGTVYPLALPATFQIFYCSRAICGVRYTLY